MQIALAHRNAEYEKLRQLQRASDAAHAQREAELSQQVQQLRIGKQREAAELSKRVDELQQVRTQHQQSNSIVLNTSILAC